MNLFFARPITSAGSMRSHGKHVIREGRRPTLLTKLLALLAAAFCMQGLVAMTAAHAVLAPVGNGFTVTPGDLSFILKQIKIAERHSTTLTASNPCGTMVAQPGDGIPDAEQVPDYLTSYGLRTVDGSCNNLKDAASNNFAAADQVFPRLTKPVFRDAEDASAFGGPAASSYKQLQGNVADSQPRVISNLIDDQTSTNPAAIAAAGHPVRSQDPTATASICTTEPTATTPGVPAGCTPAHKTLFIPNVTTDVGLSPPFNSLFTFFGQFFDHGVDQTVKSGSAVFIPLKADDPLITLGPDGVANSGDEVQPQNAFMVLTRAQNQPGPDKVLGTADDVQDATNTDTPWVDQSQTYASHPSHQVFLRQYAAGAGTPGLNNPAAVATGRLLSGLGAGATYTGSPDMTDGESTWASVKQQAAQRLGLLLQDTDVTNIPMLATDPYGKYLPGPARGLPQYVTKNAAGVVTLVEGNIAAPVPVPANVVHFDTPFVTDIAHNADPSPQFGPGTCNCTPQKDADTTVQTNFLLQDPGTYDDELLASHAACGDGRCNENIALTSIHQVFHSEHNRLATDIDNTLHQPANAALLAAYQATNGAAGANGTGRYNYGERLFQAARFVTEMEYQHLVFEEFARKVVPAVRPFHVYSPDINAAIEAEFAHAVYRFGHSMLDDDVARTNADPVTGEKTTDNSVPLLTAFLNPPLLYNGGPAGTLSASRGAGSVILGSSDQTGNEIDEFVTETLRNNLLGLPLDLPAINMARAREAGVPPLNDVRRQIFAQTNDGQLAPYTSWADYGQHLKHPESLVNFVAAYGLHPSITGATTLVDKRAAAQLLVNPPTGATGVPADAQDFMFDTGTWAGRETGLNNVDLWVGGLAEVTNLFGGHLGSTFNYVFQTQLEKLQDGDRLYYLARTPGMNLRTQLEGNSFSEMIQRNMEGTNTLKADAFATADCKFQLGHIVSPYDGSATISQTATPPIAPLTGIGSVNDDPTTADCDENQLLLKQPDGTVQYRARNNIDPLGINGQSVYQGTAGADKVNGGNDNDTFWGGAGNDRIEGNGGDDVALGGDGNDIITDLDGADTHKGGPGNDAIDLGPGDDISMGGDGSDFINGGANDNESFAGPGNDYVIAGQGADAVFGDGGDDWIEGGTGQDLLQGDHGAPFFDDPAEPAPGNDIFVGQVGENDYDAEGGDDLMAQNAAIDRNAGAGGFDWAFHQYNTVAAQDDMMINNNLGGLPIQIIINRDRWQETEADSGSSFNDTLMGTDGVLSNPRLVGGAGFTGCDALDQAGVARITGLAALLPPIATWTGTAAQTASLSASGTCPLTGRVWGEGDILLGGPGSDTITGRSGDEIIDGDRELRTAIAVTDAAGAELGRTDMMENQATSGNFGPGTTGMTLQQAVFAGLVDPGNLRNVREIVNSVTTPADCAALAPVNCDTAVFSGPRAQYTITSVNGVVTVTDNNSTPATVVGTVVTPATGDGTDTLRNVERLRFSDTTLSTTGALAPTGLSATAGNASAVLTWTNASDAASLTGFSVDVKVNGAVIRTVTGIPATTAGVPTTRTTITGLTNGTTYTFQVRGVNALGAGAPSNESAPVTPRTTPGLPTAVTATAGNAQATVSWTAPASNGGSAITGYSVQVRTGTTVVRNVSVGNVLSTTITPLTNGTAYNFRVAAVNAAGTGGLSVASAAVTPRAPVVGTVSSAPRIATAAGGVAGGVVTARANWVAPLSNGGSAITSFTVTAVQVRLNGTATGVTRTATAGANATTLSMTLPAGRYRFRVVATNGIGDSPVSALSPNTVIAR
jgi:Ca2+-binding RTX toxin-like protein